MENEDDDEDEDKQLEPNLPPPPPPVPVPVPVSVHSSSPHELNEPESSLGSHTITPAFDPISESLNILVEPRFMTRYWKSKLPDEVMSDFNKKLKCR